METWELDKWLHFSTTFYILFLTFISQFENTQNSFPYLTSPLIHSGLQNTFFEQKLPVSTAHDTFLESRHP